MLEEPKIITKEIKHYKVPCIGGCGATWPALAPGAKYFCGVCQRKMVRMMEPKEQRQPQLTNDEVIIP